MDRLSVSAIQSGLTTTNLGRRIVLYDEIDSTNTAAMDLATQGAPEGTLVLAEGQTAGRGRMGRVWYSPKGKNLYLSLVLRPSCIAPQSAWLGLAAAVACAETIEKRTGLPARVKWPNDIEISSRKVAGILMEQAVRAAKPQSLILGMGVNLNMDLEDLPRELASSATSLRIQSGGPVDRGCFLQELLAILEAWYGIFQKGEFSKIERIYLDRFDLLGKGVWIERPGGRLTGTVRGLSPEGGVRLLLPAGPEIVIHSGEVIQMRAADAAYD